MHKCPCAMAGVYRQRHPERSVFYRVLFHYFESFLLEYESRFERDYGYFRPIIQQVVDRYLDCGNPMCGFARIRCPDCGQEHLLMFSCKTRGFCPSCHAKHREEWGEWMREKLLLDVPHRQVVFTVPKMLRLFFRYKRALLSPLSLAAVSRLLEIASISIPTSISWQPRGAQPQMAPSTMSPASMMSASAKSSPMRSSPCCFRKSSSAFPLSRKSSPGATQDSTCTARSELKPRERQRESANT